MRKKKITAAGNFPLPGQTERTIVLTQTKRFGIDMDTYRSAIHNFENVDFTQRQRLYDLYADILLDPHLTSVIEKRRNAILAAPVEFVRDNKVDKAVAQQLQSPWFSRFLSDALDAKFWGCSLFQFEKDKNGWIGYTLVPRKHFDPIRKIIKSRQTDISGTPFDEFYNLLMVGDANDLGLLAKAAPYVIYKRNTFGDWSQFSELFGMPVREYTYDAADEDARNRVADDAAEQGGAGVYLHPEGTNFRLVESGNKTGSSDLYDRLTERCNSEISKLVLGNTLTTEAGDNGTQALGTVQAKGEQKILMSDRAFLLNLLNYEVTDIFAEMGIDTRGGIFRFAETEDLDLEKQLRIVQGLASMGLEISSDYLYEKFGIERPASAAKGAAVKPAAKAAQQDPDGTAEDGDGDGSGEDGDGEDGDGNKPDKDLEDKFWTRFWSRATRFFR